MDEVETNIGFRRIVEGGNDNEINPTRIIFCKFFIACFYCVNYSLINFP